MYLRLVRVKYQPDAISSIQSVYEERIIPRLQKVKGCLCACAVKSEEHPDEGLSMTLWDTVEDARAYESSGLYEQLLGEVKPYLSRTSEWKVRLSRSLTLEVEPADEEVVVKTYRSSAQSDDRPPPHEPFNRLYLRILSINLESGKETEFKRIYTDDILPRLRNIPGCRFAFMTENAKDDRSVLSVTLWESRAAADAYETSGLFESFLKRAEPTFAGLYRWKMALEHEDRGRVVTSEDISLDGYSVVTGKSFE